MGWLRYAPLREVALARVAEVEKIVRNLDARERTGEAITPKFVEIKWTWNRRLLEARLAAANDRNEQMLELRAYLNHAKARVRQAESMLHGAGIGRMCLPQYEVVDAGYRLTELMGQ
ncbi:MAG: hypothetical protein H7Z14_05975 [Anaerolineae bacterium]|nr:hypothetical protein [Phycisphaerae bacterium]